jgi:hypothetical protein
MINFVQVQLLFRLLTMYELVPISFISMIR